MACFWSVVILITSAMILPLLPFYIKSSGESIQNNKNPHKETPRPTHELQIWLEYYANNTISAHFNHMYRLCRCMWIPTKGALARPTGNQYLPVRKFVSSGANFRVPSLLAENPQIFRDRLTHSCVSRAAQGFSGCPVRNNMVEWQTEGWEVISPS